MKLVKKLWFALIVITLAGSPAYADDVVDWNQTMFRAGLVAGTSPVVMSRVAAIVQAAVFDAVNGIDRRYAPIHVPATGPAGASRDAAAVQAAYATLVRLYPTQKSLLDARLAVSLAEIATHASSAAVASGVTWGQAVANGILAWRGADGFTPAPPPFLGATTVGLWRPTPPAFAPGAVPQFATMVPWVIDAPSEFRPAGPPPLGSAQYAKDFNETKTMGSVSSGTRTADQTVFSWFWNSGTAIYIWNNLAVSLINRTDDDERWNSRDEGRDYHDDSRSWRRNTHSTTLENARLFALLNLAMADAAIGCWEAKYNYVFWRPVTAIPEAAADGNPATAAVRHPGVSGISVGSFVRQRCRGRCARGRVRRTHPLHCGIGCHARHRAFVPELFVGARRSEKRPGLCRHPLPIGHRRWSGARSVGRSLCPGARRAARRPLSIERGRADEFRAPWYPRGDDSRHREARAKPD